MFLKRTICLLLTLLLAGMLLACGQATQPEPASVATDAPAATSAPAESAPLDAAPATQDSGEYEGITFSSEDLDGNTITEAYIKANKVTVVNFWATWCPPCVGEIPDFSEVAKAYAGQGCGFLGVQLDDDADAAKYLWESQDISYPTILPSGGLVKLSSAMQYVPDTILLDHNGKQIGETIVGAIEKDALTALIDSALAAE